VTNKPTGGTVQKFKDAKGRIYYRARITLPDGERVWLKPRFDKEERAEEYAAEKTAEAHKRGVTVEAYAPKRAKAGAETCDDYFDRLSEAREAEGVTGTRKEAYDWGKWVTYHSEPIVTFRDGPRRLQGT
jgi:hypothetical protein